MHCVYLLKGNGRTYVGYSPEPHRRLKQHNGELSNGDAPVTGRPYYLLLYVHGFHRKQDALRFETAWQKPEVRAAPPRRCRPQIRRSPAPALLPSSQLDTLRVLMRDRGCHVSLAEEPADKEGVGACSRRTARAFANH